MTSPWFFFAFSMIAVVPGVGRADEGPSAIIGGDEVGECAWPSVVQTAQGSGKLCSGVLIHPQVVLTTASCGADIEKISFGEVGGTPRRVATPTKCVVHPQHNPDTSLEVGRDFQVCLLPEPMDDIPVIPVLEACEAPNVIARARSVALVGFGPDDAGDVGVKRAAFTEISHIDNIPTPGGLVSVNAVWAGGSGIGGCHQDSGSPGFVQLNDGTWRVFGVLSMWVTDRCDLGAGYVKVFDVIDWIETTGGVDVTPCHDAQGWMPGPLCHPLPVEPDEPPEDAMWSLGCANDQMGATKSCAVPDTEAPMIALVQPQDGEVFDEDADPGGGTTVEIVAEAQDAIGVQRVELSFNDEVVNMLTAPPYVWYPKLAKGTYAIRVAAFDYFGNGAGSDEIVISVGSDPDADDGDGSGDSGPGPIVAPQFGKSGCYCRTGTGAPWSTPLVLLVLLSVRRRRLHRNE